LLKKRTTAQDGENRVVVAIKNGWKFGFGHLYPHRTFVLLLFGLAYNTIVCPLYAIHPFFKSAYHIF
ncbi:MAG TPA: hypothetical protein P5121_19885, partial [Caldilineaceae bacterium]|nr:hypothetical protein [Caldilineaceae bacterium]